MTQALFLDQTGGPENFALRVHDLPTPPAGLIRIRHHYVGLNFIDIYKRTGLYPVPALPAVIGLEGAGVVESLGPGVTDLAVGDRVAYANPPLGAYAQARNMPAERLIKIPDGISDEQAAAIMLQGMTVEYLIRRTYNVKAGETVLFHAAAGGVGLMACQWLNHLGATVIGTVGSEEKAELAKANGCHHTILYNKEDIAARVREITDGAGVPVVFDSVGKDTFDASINSLAPLGLFVTFGNASGPVPPVDPGVLAGKGSLFMTRPTLMTYTAKREDMVKSAEDLFEVVQSGAVKIAINQRYPLAEAAQAHRDLEARKTTGSTILLP